jgi:hypothetical protein
MKVSIATLAVAYLASFAIAAPEAAPEPNAEAGYYDPYCKTVTKTKYKTKTIWKYKYETVTDWKYKYKTVTVCDPYKKYDKSYNSYDDKYKRED